MKLHEHYESSILSITYLICLGLILFGAGCSSKPELVTTNFISNPASALLKAINCDESLGLQDGWVWSTKGVTQEPKNGYELAFCFLAGYYGTNMSDHGRFTLHYSLEKNDTKVVIDAHSVVMNDFNGKEITPPDFTKVGRAMFSGCLQNSEQFSCLIAVQYDAYTTFQVRLDGDNGIPLASVQKLANTVLNQEDALIRKILVP